MPYERTSRKESIWVHEPANPSIYQIPELSSASDCQPPGHLGDASGDIKNNDRLRCLVLECVYQLDQYNSPALFEASCMHVLLNGVCMNGLAVVEAYRDYWNYSTQVD